MGLCCSVPTFAVGSYFAFNGSVMKVTAPSQRPMDSVPPRSANHSSHTTWFLLAFHGFAVLWGIRNIRYWENSAVDFYFPIVNSIILGWWALVDARRRHHPIPLLAKPWFFLVAGLVVPGYVIWSRSWKGLGWVVLNAFAWYLITLVFMLAGGYLVFGEDWLLAKDR